MVERGLTHKQIAEILTRETGYPVSRSSVSAALHRANATQPAKKYPDVLPWRVREEHQTHYAARMLRLLGRRRRGIQNSAEADARLDSWLNQLRESGAVVTYLEDTPDGFYYTPGEPKDGIPIVEELST